MKDLPRYLQQRGIYYGWIILIAGTLGVLASLPGQTMGVSVFTEHLILGLKIDRVNLSLAYMAGTLSSACFLPLAGRLIDKYGSRTIATIASLGLASFLLFLRYSPTLTQTLADTLNIPYKYAALFVVYIAFLGIRHFGQGQMTIASRTMMSLWFEERRGFMLGISGMFIAFGFGIAPIVLSKLNNTFEWQKALEILSLTLFGMAVFTFLFFRRSPSHSGVKIDGKGIIDKENINSKASIHIESSYTQSQAIRTPAFWIFALGLMNHSMLITAVTFHLANIGKSHQMTELEAFSIFLPASVIAISVEFVAGYLSDFIKLKYLLAIMQIGLCLGLVGLYFYGCNTGFYLTALGIGISSGMYALLNGAGWPKLFGTEHIGAINGVVGALLVTSSAFGPVLFSLGESQSGNYQYVIILTIILPLSIFLISNWAEKPKTL